MADETQTPAAKPKSKKKLLFVAGLGVLLLAGGGGAMIAMRGKKDAAKPEAGEHEATTSEEIHGDAKAEEGHGEKKEEAHAAPAEGHGEAKADAHGEKKAEGHGGGEGAAPEKKAEAPETTYAFENPFTVNLLDPGGRWFLTLMLEVETVSPEVVERVKKNLAPLRDAVIMLLSSKGTTDLRRVEGKLKLKEEIRIRMDSILGGTAIKAVYFTDFNVVMN